MNKGICDWCGKKKFLPGAPLFPEWVMPSPTMRGVCPQCAEGVLTRIDHAFFSTLLPVLNGGQRTLNEGTSHAAAVWAAKSALLYSTVNADFPVPYRHDLARELARYDGQMLPEGWIVMACLQLVDEDAPPAVLHFGLAAAEDPLAEFGLAVQFTLGVGALVVSALFQHPGLLRDGVRLAPVVAENLLEADVMAQIWPWAEFGVNPVLPVTSAMSVAEVSGVLGALMSQADE